MRRERRKPTLDGGFSLIEIAIVLIIVGLLLGGILAPLSTQQEIGDIKDTQQVLDDTELAVLGYAYGNGFLPCPDTDGDGIENFAGGNCAAAQGDVPWSTLGSPAGDGFRGNRLGYAIDASVNDHTPISCALIAGNLLRVCNAAGCAAGSVLTNRAALVLWSYGKNGYAATNAQGGVNFVPGTLSAEETENSDNDTDFIKAIRRAESPADSGFDDQLEFVTDGFLCAKMVEAGLL